MLKNCYVTDIEVILTALVANQNDAFFAKCEIEANKPYNYLELRYNYFRN